MTASRIALKSTATGEEMSGFRSRPRLYFVRLRLFLATLASSTVLSGPMLASALEMSVGINPISANSRLSICANAASSRRMRQKCRSKIGPSRSTLTLRKIIAVNEWKCGIALEVWNPVVIDIGTLPSR